MIEIKIHFDTHFPKTVEPQRKRGRRRRRRRKADPCQTTYGHFIEIVSFKT
jgi:uncharacterized protein Veg